MKPLRLRDVSRQAAKQWGAIAQGAPELLDDLDMSRTTPRGPMKRPERDAQRKVVTYLRKHLPAGSLVWSNNNTNTTAAQRHTQMADGMLPGLPDLTVIVPSKDYPAVFAVRVYFIEMKSQTGRLSSQQRDTQAALTALGVPVLSECRSVEEAVTWLRRMGVKI